MPRTIQQPAGQIKLTNVSLVRLKKGKKRFELACYKNKVMEWRQGVEKNVDEVLQIHNVFLNVSKGQVAPKDELEKAFGKGKKQDEMIDEILRKGEIQVSEKERQEQAEKMHEEVVGILCQRLVDPRTKRVYTKQMITKALDMLSHEKKEGNNKDKDKQGEKKEGSEGEDGEAAAAAAPAAKPKGPVWRGIMSNKPAKSQALDAMRALLHHQPIPVALAKMKLKVTCPTNMLNHKVKHPTAKGHAHQEGEEERKAPTTVKDQIESFFQQVETHEVKEDSWEVVGLTEPGALNHISEFIRDYTKGHGRVDVLGVEVEKVEATEGA